MKETKPMLTIEVILRIYPKLTAGAIYAQRSRGTGFTFGRRIGKCLYFDPDSVEAEIRRLRISDSSLAHEPAEDVGIDVDSVEYAKDRFSPESIIDNAESFEAMLDEFRRKGREIFTINVNPEGEVTLTTKIGK